MIPSRRSILLRCALAAGALLVAPWRGALAAGRVPLIAGINRIEGDVRINGQPARVGQIVQPGDTVSTGPGSRALYTIGESAFLQRANTEVSVAGSAAKLAMRMLTGALLAVFGKGEHRLESRAATVGIRGTGMYLETMQDMTYFCLCYGKVELTPTARPERAMTIVTRHHDSPYYVEADGTLRQAKEVINHSDDELTELERMVGRRPPFFGSTIKY